MNRLRKHGRVIGRLWRIAIQQHLAFRWQFLAVMADNVVAVSLSVLLFEIAYSHAPAIGDWTKYEAILLIGVFQLYSVFLRVFLWPNVGRMNGVIYGGELDELLLWPISPQVLISLRSIDLPSLLHGVIGLAVVVYALDRLDTVPSIWAVAAALCLLLCGVVIVYSQWFISMTLEFWFSGLWSWSSFVPNLFDFAKYPEGIYRGGLRMVFLTIAPVIVVANVPTQALLGDFAWRTAMWSLFLAISLLALSRWQWRFAVRRYTSVGS
jgi:ABC-2 type transport system permease protein